MLDETSLFHLENALRRIFALNITHSTFRELQNLILHLSGGNSHLTQDLYESLLKGEAKPGLLKNSSLEEHFEEITRQFSVLIRLAKEVLERGEFVNIVTSDIVNNQAEVALLNRIRRIDGEEFMFITDVAGTLHILQHFQGRLQELEKSETGRKQLASIKKELQQLGEKFQHIA